jgi:hypothetical protein
MRLRLFPRPRDLSYPLLILPVGLPSGGRPACPLHSSLYASIGYPYPWESTDKGHRLPMAGHHPVRHSLNHPPPWSSSVDREGVWQERARQGTIPYIMLQKGGPFESKDNRKMGKGCGEVPVHQHMVT